MLPRKCIRSWQQPFVAPVYGVLRHALMASKLDVTTLYKMAIVWRLLHSIDFYQWISGNRLCIVSWSRHYDGFHLGLLLHCLVDLILISDENLWKRIEEMLLANQSSQTIMIKFLLHAV